MREWLRSAIYKGRIMPTENGAEQQPADIRKRCAELGGRIAPTAQVSSAVRFDEPIDIGDGAVAYAPAFIGGFTYVNVGAVVFPHVRIGKFCSIGRNVQIGAARHPVEFLSSHPFQFSPALFNRVPGYPALQTEKWRFHEPTTVGNDVWLGTNCVIVAGVKIGDGAVVGAGAVVTKDVAPYEIVGGVPARRIRLRFDEDKVSRLLKTRWWDLPLDSLKDIPFGNIDQAITSIEAIRSSKENA